MDIAATWISLPAASLKAINVQNFTIYVSNNLKKINHYNEDIFFLGRGWAALLQQSLTWSSCAVWLDT